MSIQLLVIFVTLLTFNVNFSSAMMGSSSPVREGWPYPVPPNKDHQRVNNVFPMSNEKLWISKAKCGPTVYNEGEIVRARDRACIQLPQNNPNRSFRPAVQYAPENRQKYGHQSILYLYPMKRQLPINQSPEFDGNDMIILNSLCQVIGLVYKDTRVNRFMPGNIKLTFGTSKKEQITRHSALIDCVLTKKSPSSNVGMFQDHYQKIEANRPTIAIN